MKSRLFDVIKVFISLGLLFLLFQLFDFRESWAALRGIEIPYLVVAFILFQLTLLLRSFRWRFLLDALKVGVPVHRLLYLYYVGTFFNAFLPSGFGGDAIKMFELGRYTQRGSESIGTVLVDRLMGIVVLFIMGLLAWPFTFQLLPRLEAVVLLVASGGGLVATWALFQESLAEHVLGLVPGRLRARLGSLYDAVRLCGTRALGKSLAISALFSLVLFALNYFIALSLGIDIPFIYFISFMPLLSLSMLLPSVGALGTREGAYVLLFGAAGVSQPLAIAMSFSLYLINALTGIIGATAYAVDAIVGLRTAKEKRGPA